MTNIWIYIPLGYARTFFNRTVNWMFETEPQSKLGGRRIAQPRGKVLGGSSSITVCSMFAASVRITTPGATSATRAGL